VLRLLHASDSELPLTAARCSPYVCAFLALGCTVRVFEEAQGLPVPGQAVIISGLQSATGLQLNGLRAVVARFHPESGRFIVQLRPEDPPVDWKKVRAQNLVPELTPDCATSLATEGARACGRACLEAIAEIFDDLLREMQVEDLEEQEALLGRLLYSQLAVSMWEALLCCWEDRGLSLRGPHLLELCGGNPATCSHFAQNVLTAHLHSHVGLGISCPGEEDARAIGRLRGLQESFARAYCELYQPAALWGAGSGPGDAPIAQLQQDLDEHVFRMASSAVHSGVFAALASAAEFHLAWAHASSCRRTPPLVLPVLLCRVVCTMLVSTFSQEGAACLSSPAAWLQRHLRVLAPDLLGVVFAFAELLAARPPDEDITDLLAAAQPVLDMLVALTANGLGSWATSVEATTCSADAIIDLFLASTRVTADAQLSARLVLATMRRRPLEPSLAAAYAALEAGEQALFWRQLGSRGRLCHLEPSQAVQLAEEWLQVVRAAPADIEAVHVAATEQAIDQLIDKCLAELPESLAQTVVEAPQDVVLGAPPLDPSAAAQTVYRELSVLGMPALPGQAPREGHNAATASAAAASTYNGRKRTSLTRAELAKIRGVDPALAPEELRCAIDGKLLGTPMRSPQGHLFEKDTLEQWLSLCGSVCPVTGQPLRLEDCTEDKEVERRVVAWAKAAKAEHKRHAQERRRQRDQQAARPGADSGDLC